MNNLSINPQQSFTGKYRINLNTFKKGTPEQLTRDLMLGQWLDHATNSTELVNKIRNNKTGALVLDYVIPQKSEHLFEHCMQLVGQTFEKMA